MVYFASHSTAAGGLINAAVAGRRIRLRRVIVTTDTNGTVTLVQDYLGADTAVFPRIEAPGGTPADLSFDREYPITAAGLSFGYSTNIVGNHGVWVEYEIVD